jgi:hypothetical protein
MNGRYLRCQVRLEEQGGEDYAGAEPRSQWRRLRGSVGDASSVAAGGPLVATPTATVQQGVAASDNRRRGTQPNGEPHGPRLHRVLNAGPWRATADSADNHKRALFLSLSCAAATARS